MTNAALRGNPDAGNPHVRFDAGEVASAKPRRGSLLYKKTLVVCATVASLFSLADVPSLTGPYSETVDGIVWTYMLQDGQAKLGRGEWPFGWVYNGGAVPMDTAGAVVIPASFGQGQYPVTGILGDAFTHHAALTRVTIPATVTDIEMYRPFGYCTRLTAFEVSADNPNYSSAAGALMDKDGTTLLVCPPGMQGTFTISSSVTNISSSAFSSCAGVTAFEVSPDNPRYSSAGAALLDKAGKKLQMLASGFVGAYVVPSGVTAIGDYAFSECNALNRLTIPSSVSELGPGALACSYLKSVDFEGMPPTGLAMATYDFVYFYEGGTVLRYNADYAEAWAYALAESEVATATAYTPGKGPYAAGDSFGVPSGKTAQGYADEVNAAPDIKAQLLMAPIGVETSTEYLGYFDAVPSGEATIAFVLNADGTNAVVKATQSASAEVLTSVLEATDTIGIQIKKPLVGFYYSIKQGNDLKKDFGFRRAYERNNLNGQEEYFELAKPAGQGFYQIIVTPDFYTE